MWIPSSKDILIRLNVEEDVVIGVDSRDILQEIQSARQDWLLVWNVKKWGILPKFAKQRKKTLLRPGKEIYTKLPRMMISLSPYSLVEKIVEIVHTVL